MRFSPILFVVFVFLTHALAAYAEPPPLALASVYQEGVSLEDYWVSENWTVSGPTGMASTSGLAAAKSTGHEKLMASLDEVVLKGGEGLMLRRGGSLPTIGRSDDLLKAKRYQDAEAVIVAHLPGEGKYQGMLGSVRVERPDGRQFHIGTGFSDAERKNPPPVGATITYKHYGFTSTGLPRFASFMRVRANEPANIQAN